MSLGQRIRARREELNIIQQELADSLGITPQYISAIETDRKIPSLDFISELSKKLGMSIDYLVFGDEEKESTIGDIVISIKADETLDKEAKGILISLVKKLRQ